MVRVENVGGLARRVHALFGAAWFRAPYEEERCLSWQLTFEFKYSVPHSRSIVLLNKSPILLR